jgi:hypothetical protein
VKTLDLSDSKEERTTNLAELIAERAAKNKTSMAEVVRTILASVTGHPFVDDEQEESLLMAVASDFEIECENPEHEINGGGDDDDEDEEEGDD